MAQVLAIVGTDGNGTAHPSWSSNLSLALQLFEKLDAGGCEVCCGIGLRNASYNQELAPRMLLLEIGSAGNTLAEAKATAVLVGECFAALLNGD